MKKIERRPLAASFPISLLLVLLAAGGCSEKEVEWEGDAGAEKLIHTEEPQPATVEEGREVVDDPEVDHGIHDESSAAQETSRYGLIELAEATIEARSGSDVVGTVVFRRTADAGAMLVDVDISGLGPGKHGFHIHEHGDCSAQDASSAGGHFNPYETRHGGPDSDEAHVGDLGNLVANDQGRARVELRMPQLAFSGPASILQKAVVVHADADDLETDPSGNAGKRIGCGVIRQDKEILARPLDPDLDE